MFARFLKNINFIIIVIQRYSFNVIVTPLTITMVKKKSEPLNRTNHCGRDIHCHAVAINWTKTENRAKLGMAQNMFSGFFLPNRGIADYFHAND